MPLTKVEILIHTKGTVSPTEIAQSVAAMFRKNHFPFDKPVMVEARSVEDSALFHTQLVDEIGI